jgi:hypothetical protein
MALGGDWHADEMQLERNGKAFVATFKKQTNLDKYFADGADLQGLKCINFFGIYFGNFWGNWSR